MKLNKHIKKFLIYTVFAFVISLSMSSMYIFSGDFVKSMDGTLRDYMFKFRGEEKQNNNVVVIDIDEKSLATLGQWPWSRDDVAQVLINLTNANVASIGMDIIFAEHDRSSPHKVLGDYNMSIEGVENYDETLAIVIANSPTILGHQFEFEENKYMKKEPLNVSVIVVEKNKSFEQEHILRAKGTTLNIPIIQDNSYSSGFINNIPDTSGMVRSVPLIIQFEEQMFPSLAMELIRVALGVEKIVINYDEYGVESIQLADFVIPTDKHGRLMINYRGPSKTFKYISALDIYNNDFDPKDIDGKITLIGTSATGLLDLRAIPFDQVFPGVEVHANAIDNIIEEDFLSAPSYMDSINLMVIFMLTFITVYVVTYSPLWINPFIMATMGLGATYGVFYTLFEHKIIVELFIPLLSIFSATIGATFFDYIFEIRNEQLIKKKFATKVSEDVMKNLLENMDDDGFKALDREVTIFFSDVRNFTNISEASPNAQNLIEFMNTYMDPMSDIIIEHKGTIDKYIGDAIMAYWNAPSKVENHAEHAVLAALEQIHELKNLNLSIRKNPNFKEIVEMVNKNNMEPIDIGIGINTGMATVGEMGSSARSDYTVIGDAINVGARLESLCKYYNSKLNISNYTKDQLEGEYIYRFLDLVRVKGKKEPIEIWQIHDLDTDEHEEKLYSVTTEQIKKELASYHNAIDLYKQSKFKEANEIFTQLNNCEEKTNNAVYEMYIERCVHYIFEPPKDFDGVFEHTTKG